MSLLSSSDLVFLSWGNILLYCTTNVFWLILYVQYNTKLLKVSL